MPRKLKVFFFISALFFGFYAAQGCYSAAQAELYIKSSVGRGDVTGLEIPRFVSLRSSRVFMRNGPGVRYPVKWVYQRENMPVEVIQEFDTWRKIRDLEGAEGWVHQSLIAGRRYAVIIGAQNVKAYSARDKDAHVTMQLEPQAVLRLGTCTEKWCELSASAYEGWIEKKYIWGVYASERIN